MTTTISVGKKLIPLNQIVLIEPFDPASYPEMRSSKAFKARLVLIDRQSVLSEQEPLDFAKTHGFRVLEGESIAVNPAIHFAIETFVPVAGFEPRKDFKTRLQWRDLDGETQSKLLVSPPETVLAIAVTGNTSVAAMPKTSKRRTARRSNARRQAVQPAAGPEPA